MAYASGCGGEPDGGIGQRDWLGGAGIFDIAQQLACFYLWIFEYLTKIEHWACRDTRLFQFSDGFSHGAIGEPGVHGFADGFTVVGAQQIVCEPGIGDEIFTSHEPCPASEHIAADYQDDQPSIFCAVGVGWCGVKAGVAPLLALDSQHMALGQHGLHEGDAGSQQRAVHDLPFTGPRAVIQGHHHAEGSMQGSTVIFKADQGTHWRPRKTGHTHSARHGLGHGVEANSIGIWPVGTEG